MNASGALAASLALLLLLLLAVADATGAAAAAAATVGKGIPPQALTISPEEIDLRVSHIMQDMDEDGDEKISAGDVISRPHVLARHFPGVEDGEFFSFITEADTDGDSALSKSELVEALSKGLRVGEKVASAAASAADAEPLDLTLPRLVELRSEASAHEKVVAKEKATEGEKKAETAAKEAAKDMPSLNFEKPVDKSQDRCILCQYLMERIIANVEYAGILPHVRGGRPNRGPWDTLAVGGPGTESSEESSSRSGSHSGSSFLEVESKQLPSFDQTMEMQPDHNEYYNAMERQIYAEIYYVMDRTLDQVCEGAMPNDYYFACRAVFELQGTIASLVARQFGAIPVCEKINMCLPDSYLAHQIHTPPVPVMGHGKGSSSSSSSSSSF